MSATKLQPGRALKVIPSDNCLVPYPMVATTGTSTSVVANQLVASAANFITANIQPGDVVYNTTDSTAATVVSVTNATTLVLNADIFLVVTKAFTIYQMSAVTSMGNPGCVLYIGGTGNLNITTIGGDTVLFSTIAASSFFPVQVNQVRSTTTTATNIIALW
jgi:hypothetical protein